VISQSTFIIPPEIEARLLSGDFIQYGGIVRNRLGQIVKHLKEILHPIRNDKAMARVAETLKNPRVLIPTVLVGAAAVGGTAFAAARRRKQASVPECVERYNASLGAYLEAVHEGRLNAGIIDRLISDLDVVVDYSDENGNNITLDFSTKRAAMLVKIVVDSTRQLAEENSINLSEPQEESPASDGGAVVDLRRYLEVQKKIFTDAA